jgi:hypothetical protein
MFQLLIERNMAGRKAWAWILCLSLGLFWAGQCFSSIGNKFSFYHLKPPLVSTNPLEFHVSSCSGSEYSVIFYSLVDFHTKVLQILPSAHASLQMSVCLCVLTFIVI